MYTIKILRTKEQNSNLKTTEVYEGSKPRINPLSSDEGVDIFNNQFYPDLGRREDVVSLYMGCQAVDRKTALYQLTPISQVTYTCSCDGEYKTYYLYPGDRCYIVNSDGVTVASS